MERNLLVLQGALREIRGVPPEVQPLFREQFQPAFFDPRFAHAATTVSMQTVCYRDGRNYLLPEGAVVPEEGVVVEATLVTQLPTLAQLQPVSFPAYAQDLLHSPFGRGCLLEAAKIASGKLSPNYYGEQATRAMLTDIYIGAVAAEGRHPGLLHARLARPRKQFLHWLVWLGRNANDRRRERRQAPLTLSLEEHLLSESDVGGSPIVDDVAEVYDMQQIRAEQCEWAVAQVTALRILPPDVLNILRVVGEVGTTYQAAKDLGIPEADVHAALREARVLLQAQALLQHDLAGISPETRAVLVDAATAGLQFAVYRSQHSPRWVMQTLRDVQLLLEARMLLRLGDSEDVRLSEEMTNVLSLMAEQGQRKTAATLGVALTMLQEVLDDAREQIAAHGRRGSTRRMTNAR